MTRNLLLCAGLLAVFAMSAGVPAQEQRSAAPNPSAPPGRATLEQKHALVARLLGDSPAAKRIAGSTNAEAKQYMAIAQQHEAQAAAALAAGELPKTDALLNEALWMIGKARQLVPDTMYRVIEWRFRYARMQDVVDALYDSYEKHLTRVSASRAPRDKEEIVRVIAEARSFRTSEQIPEAVASLERAERMLLLGLNQMLGSETIEYTQKFESPSEEFAHELQRNRSYVELVPIAISQLKPGPEALRLAARYMESNQTLTEQAQHQAARKNFPAALKGVREGTVSLQRALAATGLVVPQDMKPE